ncbi:MULTISPECIES: RMD1 family protein [unclassified Cellulophaga]|uniref:RMD1 family protein n=1 Tax=unclassified Cellulophaga TaxID=2634405 RepID=UPI0026E17CB0|nr:MULTISPECIES: RMD1 family protein [unclassified Cellulophaga]MDO6490482.1 RMD1 family protein [Cellulophaga sp. 2_MG-2023]MDO6494324.1 RMD1 family protein [Cellulophaga sp. 3_MG-2023]
MYSVDAYQIAASISIRECKRNLTWDLIFSDGDELFYKMGDTKFVYIFQYGMVGFFNHTLEEKRTILDSIKPFCKGLKEERFSEEVNVVIEPTIQEVSFNKIIIPSFDYEAIRLIVLNASQSVALDNYFDITEQLLGETNEHTKYLEQKGKLNISGNKLKRFIGRVLNIKNEISENLYIFDSPDITWDNEALSLLNLELKKTFDLKDRYRYIYERLGVIKENLELFKDIMDHKESSRLEWIIIILIVIEVLDMFILKLT